MSLGVILAAAETIWLAVFIYLPILGLSLKNWNITLFYPWILVKWVGNDGILKKLIDFCHFEFMESKNYQYMSSETSILSLFWCMFLRFLATNFRNKKNPYRVHQVNFLLQNINDGDKMKAWKHLTHHGMTKSYGWKVHFSCLGTLKNSILMRLA